MEIVREENIIHSKPASKNNEEYPYTSSAKIFHTKQLFLYSEKVEPGKKSSAPHFHKAIDEIIVVTKGEFHAFEGDKETILKSGDSICFLANSEKKHYLENKSILDSEFLLFRKSISQDDVVY
jgi:uncharacterized cupin superfamily protein